MPDDFEIHAVTDGKICLTSLVDFDVEAEGELDENGKEIPSLPKFKMLAYTGGKMKVRGLKYPVVVDLQGVNVPKPTLPVRDHHWRRIGHTEDITVTKDIRAEGVISCTNENAREIVNDARNGFPWQASIGAAADKLYFTQKGQTVAVNGRQFKGPVFVARKSTLGEISFVEVGADMNTSIQVAAQAMEDEMPEDKNKKGDGQDKPKGDTTPTGLSAGGVAGDIKKNLQANADDDTKQTIINAAAEELKAFRVETAKETRRVVEIHKLCGATHGEIAAKAIEENWGTDKTELEVIKAERPKPPAGHIQGDNSSVSNDILECASLMATGYEGAKIEKAFKPEVLEASGKLNRGRFGLGDLFIEAARANGYRGDARRVDPEIMRYAFGGYEIQAAGGWSTVDIGGILSNIGNKHLLESFMDIENVWSMITSRKNVSDFKTVTSYRLTGDEEYELVPPGGEIKHGNLGDVSFTNKADTYGKMFDITRTDIINDDLDAISKVPQRLGRGGALKINKLFWTAFMANTTFFTSARGNLSTGAGSALTVAGLTTADRLFMDQTDPSGNPTSITPTILLVPTNLKVTASILMKSAELRNTTADTEYGVANPHAGAYQVLVSRYLTNSNITGNSTKAWYVLGKAAGISVIEMAFLNGVETPIIETADADFNVLGVSMRGFHDFGVSKQEYRAGVKSDGE